MTINYNELPSYIKQPIFVKGNVRIDMEVDLGEGRALFLAYINGEYVSFSRDDSIYSTLRVLNNELELMEIHKRSAPK